MPPHHAANAATPAAHDQDAVRRLAAETLELTAWILTPEDGYEPVGEPVPTLLRAAACRLQRTRPERGPALCRQVYEVAAAATAYVLAVRHLPGPDPTPTLDLVNVLTRLETAERATLPDAMRHAAFICRYASPHKATGQPAAPAP